MEKERIELLKAKVQNVFGREVRTPKDFELLSESVFERTSVLMSPTTFKRLWGYIDEPVTPRRTTLDVLAKYTGWNDWTDFCKGDTPDAESGVVASDSIDVLRQLKPGDEIRLTWQPGRVCDIEYLGDARFKVIGSEATKLTPGDTFSCHLIVAGEPLYLDNLQKEGHRPATYVCGRLHGVSFRVL